MGDSLKTGKSQTWRSWEKTRCLRTQYCACIGTVIGGFGKVGCRNEIQCLVVIGTCSGEERRRWQRLVKVGHLFVVHIHGGQ